MVAFWRYSFVYTHCVGYLVDSYFRNIPMKIGKEHTTIIIYNLSAALRGIKISCKNNACLAFLLIQNLQM